MQGIYTYIPETNHVPREYSVSAIMSLLFMVSISLVPGLALQQQQQQRLLLLLLLYAGYLYIHIFLRQTMSLGNKVFQLFCHYYLWCLYR